MIIIDKVILYLCRVRAEISYSTDKLTDVNALLVELRADGLSGWGEVFLARVEPLWSWARRVAPLIKGQDAVQLDDLIEKWPKDRPKMAHEDCATYCHEDVDCVAEAISIALHDLVARAKGIPLGGLLGKIERTAIPGMPVITLAQPALMAKQAAAWAQAGYTHLKVKLSGNESEDLERLDVICANVGEGVKWQVDANGVYPDLKAASSVIDALNKHQIEVVEDLFDTGNLELCREACRALKGLYMVDKDAYWPHVKVILRHQAAELINQHPHNQGRLSYALKIVQAVHEAGKENAIGSSGIFGIQNAAFQHLASITGLSRPCEDIGAHNYFDGPVGNVSHYAHSPCVLKQPFPIVKGNIQLSPEAGLGVEVDRGLLNKVMVANATF